MYVSAASTGACMSAATMEQLFVSSAAAVGSREQNRSTHPWLMFSSWLMCSSVAAELSVIKNRSVSPLSVVGCQLFLTLLIIKNSGVSVVGCLRSDEERGTVQYGIRGK